MSAANHPTGTKPRTRPRRGVRNASPVFRVEDELLVADVLPSDDAKIGNTHLELGLKPHGDVCRVAGVLFEVSGYVPGPSLFHGLLRALTGVLWCGRGFLDDVLGRGEAEDLRQDLQALVGGV